jgi:signal transduction histidine kinase
MAERDRPTILIVSADAERARRRAALLENLGHVSAAGGVGEALAAIERRRPDAAVLDADLGGDGLVDLVEAVGDEARVVLCGDSPPLVAERAVFVHVPGSAPDGVLREAVRWVVAAAASRARLARVADAVRRVRHDINSPLTAIMAETDLLLMDAEDLTEEQRRSLETIAGMARRIRDLLAELRAINNEE